MMKQVQLILLAIILSACLPISNSQGSESPIIELLSLIPDTPEIRSSIIHYADIEAAIRLRGTPPVESIAEWQRLIELYDPISKLNVLDWLSALPYTINPNLTIREPELMAEFMGIDVFSIRQTLQVTNPPEDFAIIAGDFDEAAILAAYEARGYMPQEDSTIQYLCSANDCSSGMEVSLSNRQDANIFGGDLGRSQNIGIIENVLFSSPSETLMNASLSVLTDEHNSIMDNDMLSTSIQAMLDLGEIRAATLYMNTGMIAEALAGNSAEGYNLEILPNFEFFALADIVDANNSLERAAIVLVYDNEADAMAASEALFANLNNRQLLSVTEDIAYASILEGRGGNIVMEELYRDAQTGYYAVRVIIEEPLVRYGTIRDRNGEREIVDAYPEDLSMSPVDSSISFIILNNMVSRRDYLWLYVATE